jgi:serine/threonine protein kinase
VAIKRLYSSNKIEFEKEVAILKALGSRTTKHLHLITLLATFKHHNKYHLIFPWADANLRKFWKDRPFPNFDEVTFLWSLKQMTGIANALDSIHNIAKAYPPPVDCPSNFVEQKDAKSSNQRNKTLYGRHGDIKPENILWFRRIEESEDKMGVLQIADFGLGGFHGRDSRSKIDPNNVVSSPTYEPPECQLLKPVSRAYDIWSVGCLYLEFITWLLMGAAKIDEFSNKHFFTITPDGNDAVVREGVVDWVQKLHEHERCSALIHNLLELIMKRVLIPNSQERMPAAELYEELNGLLEKAKEDKVYLLKPVPWRQKSGHYPLRSVITFTGLDAQKTKTNSKEDVNSFNQGEFGSSSVVPPNQTDLVDRVAGTPGQIKRAQTLGALPSLGKVNG